MADIKTQGTLVEIDTGSSTFVAIGGVSSISGLGGGEAADIDVTDFASTAREFLQGLPDEGNITLSGNYDPADVQQTLMETKRSNQEVATFRITLQDTGTTEFEFNAFVKSFEKNLEADDAVRFSVSLRITGAITITTT